MTKEDEEFAIKVASELFLYPPFWALVTESADKEKAKEVALQVTRILPLETVDSNTILFALQGVIKGIIVDAVLQGILEAETQK
jgi:hypothetical protein